ncbi:MAG: thiamine phosphate synthase [gamma proteobacterium symbiont of Bathyaustriella thionipta]|nr:thiamine phosphate synthase [gamma proteobacterium symbiont of Bathyaustriella thionipta]
MKGLYGITANNHHSLPGLLQQVEAAINGGMRILQYRNKSSDSGSRYREAKALQDLCQQQQIPLIINDDMQLAVEVDAAGVHLGKEDGCVADCRQRLGHNKMIGVSCYNSIEQALLAEQQGADYVAFGRFFPSSSKPLASPADINTLQQAKEKLSIPIVAIGGINADNGGALIAAGADMLAVIAGLFAAADIQAAARQLTSLFEESS